MVIAGWASVAAWIGAIGALATLAWDLIHDSRGWQTNDALVLFCLGGSLASLFSLSSLAVGIMLSERVLSRSMGIAILGDIGALFMTGAWVCGALASH